MRRILTASLLGLSLLLAACGGSDDSNEETGAGQPATGGDEAESTTTTAPKQDGPGCRALKGYLNAELIAYRKVDEGAITPETKTQIVVGIDNTSTKLKELLPGMVGQVDARVVVVKTRIDAGEVTPEQQAAADDALKKMNNYRRANCAPPAAPPKDLPASGQPSTTATTAAPAAP